tara:strand:+ start:3865 stop:4242 length:378 start_codon:yes stop_codon:yes gene_type:complete
MTDIDFKFQKNSFTDDVSQLKTHNAIKQSIKNIILTLKGEKSFGYNFGAASQRMLFEPSSTNNIGVATEIQNCLAIHEPRIFVTEVSFSNLNEETKINISYEKVLNSVSGETTKVTETTSVTTSY